MAPRAHPVAIRVGVARVIRGLALLLGIGLLAACSKSPSPAPPAPGPAASGAGGAPAASTRAAGAAPWSGAPLRGDDPAAIRAYLSSVVEIQPRKFDVRWNPATVAIDKATAMRALRRVSHDGAVFTFAAGEPAVAGLKAGSILWIYDIAIRKVDSVDEAAGAVKVHTSPVHLNEAIPDANIEFEAPVRLQDYYPQRSVESPGETGSAQLHAGPWRMMPVALTDLPPEDLPDPAQYEEKEDDDWYDAGITANGYSGTKNGWAYSVGYRTRPGGISLELQARKGDLEGQGDGGGKTSLIPEYKQIEADRQQIQDAVKKAVDELDKEEQGIRDTDADFKKQMAQLLQDQANRSNPAYQGPRPPPQVNEYGHPITDAAAQQRLKDQWQAKHDLELKKLQATEQILGEWRIKHDQLEARKRALKVAGGVAAQLWQIASEDLDARIRARVDLDGFSSGMQLAFVNGDIQSAATQFKQLNGKVYAQLIGRLGKPGNQATKVPVMHIPVSFNIPMPVGGIPFVLQTGADFLLTLSLSGMHASLTADGQAAFSGDGGFTYAQGKASYEDSFHSGQPEITKSEGMSPGVSAVVLGVQLPRLGMGLGVWGVSSVAYLDLVHVITITQSASTGAMMLAPLCRRTTYNTVGHVGIETQVISLPFASTEKINDALSTQKHEIFNTKTVKLDPPVKACEI